jgi:hypothetical protein
MEAAAAAAATFLAAGRQNSARRAAARTRDLHEPGQAESHMYRTMHKLGISDRRDLQPSR